MNLSDETLMAYADGELDPRERAAIEAAMARDAGIAQRIERFRAQRETLRRAFESVLDEPVPERLVSAARSSPGSAGTVVGLDEARGRRASATARRWTWPQWTALAASLLVGLIVGRAVPPSGDAALFASRDAGILARGALAAALTERLAGDDAGDARLAIGLSYRAKSGEYCRTFSATRGAALAGVACREGDAWRVRMLSQDAAAQDSGAYRQAGSALPAIVAEAVQAHISGEPLDASAEAAARAKGWRE